MTRYQILGTEEEILEESGVVIKAEGILSPWLQQPMSVFLKYAKRMGWVVKPVPLPECASIEVNSTVYHFTWNNGVIIRITRTIGEETRDITIKELPAFVRNLL